LAYDKLLSLDAGMVEMRAESFDRAKHLVLDRDGYPRCRAVNTEGSTAYIAEGRKLRFQPARR